jgi:hypothetical protein
MGKQVPKDKIDLDRYNVNRAVVFIDKFIIDISKLLDQLSEIRYDRGYLSDTADHYKVQLEEFQYSWYWIKKKLKK